jgi:molybdopterin-binding protein
MRLSARNQLPAKVVNVTEGPATAVVELDVDGLRLVASITAEAARELALSEGAEVTAIVKASDVMLGVND